MLIRPCNLCAQWDEALENMRHRDTAIAVASEQFAMHKAELREKKAALDAQARFLESEVGTVGAWCPCRAVHIDCCPMAAPSVAWCGLLGAQGIQHAHHQPLCPLPPSFHNSCHALAPPPHTTPSTPSPPHTHNSRHALTPCAPLRA